MQYPDRMRAQRAAVFAFLLWLSLGSTLAAQPPAAESEARFDLTWRLEASIRHRRADGDVWAGGQVRLVDRSPPEQDLVLELEEVREAPWKLYWVDPWGPFGEEVKVASVIDLPEGSWAALAMARQVAESEGRRRYEEWAAQRSDPPPFDGSFAFVVIGPAWGRLRLRLPAEGGAAEPENRLTDRWLVGPFDRWVGSAWPEVDTGYWFWNAGPEGPFPYEPHTYHALMKILPRLERGSQAPADWPERVLASTLAMVRTLVPRISQVLPEATEPFAGGQIRRTVAPGYERFDLGGASIERRVSATGVPELVAVQIKAESTSIGLRLELGLVESD